MCDEHQQNHANSALHSRAQGLLYALLCGAATARVGQVFRSHVEGVGLGLWVGGWGLGVQDLGFT